MRYSRPEDVAAYALQTFARRETLSVLYHTQGKRCCICDQQMDPLRTVRDQRNPMRPTLEHVDPQGRGGPDAKGNILAAHARCNNDKGAKAPGPFELAVLDRVNAALGWASTRRRAP